MAQTRQQTTTGIRQPGEPALHRLVTEYDATVDAVTGTVAMRGDTLPSGAIITDALLAVDTVFAGAGVSVAIQAEAANDIATVAAITGSPWSTATPKRATLTATSTPVKTTADRAPSLVITGGSLTAGRCRLIVEYYLMDA